MQAALEAAFPQCSDLSADEARGISAFTPHLSLGQFRTPAEVEAAAAQLRAGWQPLAFQAEGVALIARSGYLDPFTVRWFVPFGAGGAPAQPGAVNAPYIATVGEAAPGSGDAAQRWGLGAARPDGSVWQFAYGANMAPRKLNGARGLAPLESLPASLPGWRLAFTHRGAMGNLERLAPGEAAPSGLPAVHGVLHRLTPAEYGQLACMEHEYRWAGLLGEGGVGELVLSCLVGSLIRAAGSMSLHRITHRRALSAPCPALQGGGTTSSSLRRRRPCAGGGVCHARGQNNRGRPASSAALPGAAAGGGAPLGPGRRLHTLAVRPGGHRPQAAWRPVLHHRRRRAAAGAAQDTHRLAAAAGAAPRAGAAADVPGVRRCILRNIS